MIESTIWDSRAALLSAPRFIARRLDQVRSNRFLVFDSWQSPGKIRGGEKGTTKKRRRAWK